MKTVNIASIGCGRRGSMSRAATWCISTEWKNRPLEDVTELPKVMLDNMPDA